MNLPKPPQRLLDSIYPRFEPAPELKEWAYATFIEEGSPLLNVDHEHLRDAEILFLWSSKAFKKAGKVVVGTAQRGLQQGALGKKELLEYTYRTWYGGELPDFVITLCAPYFHEVGAVSACATTEHELYHCGQMKDEWGNPLFTESNWPKWTMRGHDIEEFVGVAARYGPHNAELSALKTVFERGPLIEPGHVQYVCGCGARV